MPTSSPLLQWLLSHNIIVCESVSVCTPRLQLYCISITSYKCVSLFPPAGTSALLGPRQADHSSAGGLHSNLPSFVTICSSWQIKCYPPPSFRPQSHMGSAALHFPWRRFSRITFLRIELFPSRQVLKIVSSI